MASVFFSSHIPTLLNIVWILYYFYLFTIKNIKMVNSKKIHSSTEFIYTNLSASIYKTQFFLITNIIATYSTKVTSSGFSELLSIYNLASLILSFTMLLILTLKRYLRGVILQINIIYPGFLVLLYIFFLSTNYINLLVALELIAVSYYYLFLESAKTAKINPITYKNLVNNYLWLSFFTLVLYCIGFIFLVYNVGLVDFTELSFYKNNSSLHWALTFLLISFLWKLGLSGFHFYKLELYKYFSTVNLFLFIIISFIINSFIMYVFCYWLSSWGFTINFPLFILILVVNTLLLLYNSEKITLAYFLAVSSINTWIFLMLTIFI